MACLADLPLGETAWRILESGPWRARAAGLWVGVRGPRRPAYISTCPPFGWRLLVVGILNY